MDNIKITIEGEGLSVTKHTNLQKAGQIISFLGMENNQSPTSSYSSSNTQISTKQLGVEAPSLKKMIESSNARTYPQKIAVLGLYVRATTQEEVFTQQELKGLFKKIGDEPKNFSRDFNEALEKGYIYAVDAIAGQYAVTETGIESFQQGSWDEVIGKKKSSTVKRSIARGVREEIKVINFQTVLDGYPGYHDLPTVADKILWILAYADGSGIQHMTSSEIDYASGQLRQQIGIKGFGPHNKRNIHKSFVTPSSGGFKIQQKGINHLKELLAQ